MQLNLKIPTKKCSCCGLVKPVSEFYRQSYTDQLSNQCKTCTNTKRRVDRDKTRTSKFISKERQREMKQDIEYTAQDWKDAMVYFGGGCAFCGAKEGRAKASKLDKDHLIPLSQGGRTVRENIIPACRRCNRGRGNRLWEPWFMQQSFYSLQRADRIRLWVGGGRDE